MLAPYKSIQTSDISCPRGLSTWNNLELWKEPGREPLKFLPVIEQSRCALQSVSFCQEETSRCGAQPVKVHSVVTLRCYGRLVYRTGRHSLCAAVPHHGRDMIVDLSGVSAIAAAGIGALVSLQAAGESLTAATPATDPASIPALPTRAR